MINYTEKGKNQVCMLYTQNEILKRSWPVVVERIYFRGKFHFVLGLLATDIEES